MPYSDQALIEAVLSSVCVREVLIKLGLKPAGGNYKVFHSNVRRLELDTSHFTGQSWRKGNKDPVTKKRPLSDILVENSPHKTTSSLRARLLQEGVFEPKCYACNLDSWMGKDIPLELEHKNGVNNDHRLENLTLLCPNCHAQTSTYRGKNRK